MFFSRGILIDLIPVASKILARVEENESHTVMAIIPHSYLTNRFQQSFIAGLNPGYCFIDEADMLPDSLISENQQYLTLAQTRSRLDHPYDKACNFKCSACHLHFSDTFTGGIRPSRSLNSEADYHEVGQPNHFSRYLRSAVEKVKPILGPAFDYEAVERNIGRVEKALTAISSQDKTPYEFIDGLQREPHHHAGTKLEVISEGLEIEVDGRKRQIKPKIHVTLVEAEKSLILHHLPPPAESDKIQVDDDGTIKVKNFNFTPDTELGHDIKTFLHWVNFTEKAPAGQIGIYYELRSEYWDQETKSDYTDFGYKRGTVKSCGIVMRYLDIETYRKTVDFLKERKSILLSGSFFNHQLLAESFLSEIDDIRYISARVDMHRNYKIIHHNPSFGQLAPESVDLKTFGNAQVAELTQAVIKRRKSDVLVFGSNKKAANLLFNSMAKDEGNRNLLLENNSPELTEIAPWNRLERGSSRKGKSSVVIDKLRSAESRAVNRSCFDLIVVHGNGYPNFHHLLPFTIAIRQSVNEHRNLDQLIHYNRQRAVIQALLRNPRDENLKVGIYLSGDMSHLDYPTDLLGRVVTTNSLLRQLKEKHPDQFLNSRKTQIDLLSRVVSGFLEGEIERDISAVIEDFKFKDSHNQTETIDLSVLTPVQQHIFYGWLELQGDSANNHRTQRSIINRIQHVHQCIQDKGHLDKKGDRKGKRPDWDKWILFLMEKGYLTPHILETKTKPKTVYLLAK